VQLMPLFLREADGVAVKLIGRDEEAVLHGRRTRSATQSCS
jgi:hypothetical protein